MAFEIVCYPDPILKKRSAPVEAIDDALRHRIAEMFSVLYRERGVGLAAPQVGWSVRIFIANTTGEPDPATERVYINPKIILAEGEIRDEEGCLSFPDIRGAVTRSQRVIVRAQDLRGEFFEEDAVDLAARAIQHELDHLDGILFISRLSLADRLLVNKALKKLEKEFKAHTARAR
jgi:peptide deformylase